MGPGSYRPDWAGTEFTENGVIHKSDAVSKHPKTAYTIVWISSDGELISSVRYGMSALNTFLAAIEITPGSYLLSVVNTGGEIQ